MNDALHPDMLEATRLTRLGRLTEATALLQRALRSGPAPDTAADTTGEPADAPSGRASRLIEQFKRAAWMGTPGADRPHIETRAPTLMDRWVAASVRPRGLLNQALGGPSDVHPG